jgi:hypothetical protein
MKKIDHKKLFKHLYNPSAKKPELIAVPPMNFLMIDGQGDPNTSKDYAAAVEALFTLAYTIKFMIKKTQEIDYKVMLLEGLWWAKNMNDFVANDRKNWQWTMMIMQPDIVTKKIFAEALAQAQEKKGLPKLAEIRFETYDEGLVGQLMHVGPFSAEGPNIQKIHEYILESGKKLSGKHHEIYLNDPRKTNPAKMKTVLRQQCS